MTCDKAYTDTDEFLCYADNMVQVNRRKELTEKKNYKKEETDKDLYFLVFE